MANRQEFSRSVKLAAWERAGGCCESCRRKIFPGDGPEYDHIITCEQGGDNSLKNCQVLCIWCHKPKTREDLKTTAKSRSIRAQHVNAKTIKRPMQGSRGSKWKKKLNGEVVER